MALQLWHWPSQWLLATRQHWSSFDEACRDILNAISYDRHMLSVFQHQIRVAFKDAERAELNVKKTLHDIDYKTAILHKELFSIMLRTSHRKFMKLLSKLGL